jgi:hypothetical protein
MRLISAFRENAATARARGSCGVASTGAPSNTNGRELGT